MNSKPYQRRDYSALAERYNALEKGRALELPGVSNITDFKRTLLSHGISPERDFKAYTKRGRTYIKRMSNTFMKGA